MKDEQIFHQSQLLPHPADRRVAQIRRKLDVVGQRTVIAWVVGYRWKNDDGA